MNEIVYNYIKECPECGRKVEDIGIYENISSIVLQCSCGWSKEIKQ